MRFLVAVWSNCSLHCPAQSYQQLSPEQKFRG
jgi:hypothetical protein